MQFPKSLLVEQYDTKIRVPVYIEKEMIDWFKIAM